MTSKIKFAHLECVLKVNPLFKIKEYNQQLVLYAVVLKYFITVL